MNLNKSMPKNSLAYFYLNSSYNKVLI